jgi:hypothetical protein
MESSHRTIDKRKTFVVWAIFSAAWRRQGWLAAFAISLKFAYFDMVERVR